MSLYLGNFNDSLHFVYLLLSLCLSKWCWCVFETRFDSHFLTVHGVSLKIWHTFGFVLWVLARFQDDCWTMAKTSIVTRAVISKSYEVVIRWPWSSPPAYESMKLKENIYNSVSSVSLYSIFILLSECHECSAAPISACLRRGHEAAFAVNTDGESVATPCVKLFPCAHALIPSVRLNKLASTVLSSLWFNPIELILPGFVANTPTDCTT